MDNFSFSFFLKRTVWYGAEEESFRRERTHYLPREAQFREELTVGGRTSSRNLEPDGYHTERIRLTVVMIFSMMTGCSGSDDV